ncbi:cysteine desulfurase family protein [Clostridium acetobutylicum]|uniref:cysteine desulfurase n=1 Tax=Clostridium acetobutylicum (strain ATCC 824 / DSM 792 / JCM 1419 / IAM 19013 / LMG 5710 / NBRC 13948 / NRRL B-527 / VKM B-1787 / 2291 / W) TaxID=272562 RepID=Q97GL2_CLOAB|nr:MULTISPECIES: aminotransferase class V-fold PLP-dependent enzyme [Clostridium]AAK80310.1 Nifs family aminotransferase [Clostridium acetobutylicum ATCC 824]ADZ21405.1 Nifs family aminotransferase [Clostridium acetobutylicum EA 2018]AEI34682.1 Nifs family aminotransferase [Clostridium acetobutylicum DSM 1731]AWV79269.1 aminotransferase class V-fold PLP-dependent enzyme [Clostridium acetobutylicum]MBC2394762.1 aminotransferase class V-fold PLP-dependent enzyme [Clostridium acetobutylicum]
MIYLDNAATTFPKPDEVYNEVLDCMKNYAANPGRGSYDMAIKASHKVTETREIIAKLFNISDLFNVIFTCSATEALNIGIKGLLKRKNHVITTCMEHNSVLRPISHLKKKGVECSIVRADQYGFISPKEIEKLIRSDTKLIVVNHVSNVTGTIQNIDEIGEIAHKNGVCFMVDAAQSAGVLNIDVEKSHIDMLAFPGHKGLMGPQGTGGLFIREGIKLTEFKSGGTGSNSFSVDQPEFLPDRFESGTLNTPGISGLNAGIKFINSIGLKNIEKHEMELTEYLIRNLKNKDYVKIYGHELQNRGAVVSFNIDGIDSSDVAAILNVKGICVRNGYHCAPLVHEIIGTKNRGTVRVSPGYFNTIEDIDKLIEAVVEINKGKI